MSAGVWQVKDTVSGANKETAAKAKYNADYAQESAKQYAKAGQAQADSATESAKQAASDAYHSAAEAARGANEYVGDAASTGWVDFVLSGAERLLSAEFNPHVAFLPPR